MSYLVTQRTRELGIRMALGADGAGLRRYVVGRGLRLAAIGVVSEFPRRSASPGSCARMLFSVSPGDPVVLGAVVVLLAGISILASWRPAQHATRVDPLIALRAE